MKHVAHDPAMSEQTARDIVCSYWDPTRHFDEVLFAATCTMLRQVHAAMINAFATQIQSILDDADQAGEEGAQP